MGDIIKSQNNAEEFYSRLTLIGKAMFAYYNGQYLDDNQIDLIANSSSEDKILGMNIVAGDMLLIGKKYNYFFNNTNKIKTRKKVQE